MVLSARNGRQVAVAILMVAVMAFGNLGSAAAQDSFGWYGPYDDGCYYWWDGYQWTGDVDCDGDGYVDAPANTYAAGWYGPYDDGCYYWWNGNDWTTDVDCDGDGFTDTAATVYPADWYGPYDDGCYYWWDGTKYSGELDCDGDGYTDATEETYQPGWYDLYGDGCLYWFDGSAYTGDSDCNGDGLADTVQRPDDIDTSTTDDYIDTQFDAINQMWAERFRNAGLDYSTPRLVIATDPINVACTTADGDQLLETEDWIFYCSGDESIYFGPGNLEKIVQSGIGAVQFTVAHEFGHHVQSEMDPSFATNYGKDTVAYENQATCMAGVWFNELDAQGLPSDLNAAMTFLGTATDDVHGKSDDQIAALLKGYHDPDAC